MSQSAKTTPWRRMAHQRKKWVVLKAIKTRPFGSTQEIWDKLQTDRNEMIDLRSIEICVNVLRRDELIHASFENSKRGWIIRASQKTAAR